MRGSLQVPMTRVCGFYAIVLTYPLTANGFVKACNVSRVGLG